MHHRRGSSLAVISGANRPDDATSSTMAKPPRPTLASQSFLSLPSVPEQPPTMSKRRLSRSFALLLAFVAITVLLLACGYFDGSSLGTTADSRYPFRNDYVQNKNAHRPYPPNTAPGRRPPVNDWGKRPKPLKGKGGDDAATFSDTSNSHNHNGGTSPALKLTPAEELGAVVAYLTSIGANAHIPSSIDPSKPLDAELILGFNARSSRASAEVAELVDETWQINPVVMFGEARQPTTKALKELLDALNLSPKPVFFFLDERDDGNVLAPLIKRLTGGTGFPILLIGGQHQGDFDNIEKLFSSGDLQRRLNTAGATFRAAKVRKGRRRQ